MRALALLIVALAGCAPGERLAPVHEAVVCAVEGEKSCASAERGTAFNRWARDGLRRPGSTFAVWVVDGAGSPRAAFTACVPEAWGPGVMEAKAAFLREGHRRASVGGEPLPGGCAATTELVGNVEVLGEGRRWRPVTAADPLHVAVVCDQSDSMLGLTCDEGTLQAAFDAWMAQSGGMPGSSFEVFGVGTSRDGVERLAHVLAEGVPAGERVALLLAARGRLDTGLDAAPTGSAVAEAVSVAAATLRSRTGGRDLVILSDLRQVTPGASGTSRSRRHRPRPSPNGSGRQGSRPTLAGSRSVCADSTTGGHPAPLPSTQRSPGGSRQRGRGPSRRWGRVALDWDAIVPMNSPRVRPEASPSAEARHAHCHVALHSDVRAGLHGLGLAPRPHPGRASAHPAPLEDAHVPGLDGVCRGRTDDAADVSDVWLGPQRCASRAGAGATGEAPARAGGELQPVRSA